MPLVDPQQSLQGHGIKDLAKAGLREKLGEAMLVGYSNDNGNVGMIIIIDVGVTIKKKHMWV